MLPRILTTSFTAILLASLRASAVTDTWDGGGIDDFISTNNNWLDNSAPVSDLVNTDLIFAGTARLTPNFSDHFQVDSITFSDTAGAFDLMGLPLNIGTTGVIDNDADTQTFSMMVIVGTPTTTINAASGGLSFAGGLFPNGNAVTYTGAGSVSMAAFNGGGSLTALGSGTVSIASGGSTIAANLNIYAGTTQFTATGSTQTISSTVTVVGGAIAFNESTILDVGGVISIIGGTFNSNGNLLMNGGQLTRNAVGILVLGFGKTVTVQNSGDVMITGSFIDAGSPITVTGTGSTFTTTSNLTLRDGGDTQILAGATLSSGSLIIGKATDIVVDGGSSLSGGPALLGAFGNVSTLTFTNGGTGTFTSLGVARSSVAGTTGILSIQSGASVSGGGLFVGDQQFVNTAGVTITGAGSALTITGSGMTVIGAASTSTATLTVENGGTFTTGTGTTTVNATGDLNVNAGGTMIVRGNMTVHNSLDITGTVILSANAPPAPDEFAAMPESELGFNEGHLSVPANIAGVPEPGIGALLSSALVLLGLHRRRPKERRFPTADVKPKRTSASLLPTHRENCAAARRAERSAIENRRSLGRPLRFV